MIDDPVIWKPVMDFYELEEEYVVNAEIPGVERRHVTVELCGDELVIRGERKNDEFCKKEKYHRLEGRRGKFLRTFSLPKPVDKSRMQIKLEDGILRAVLPKIDLKK